MYKRMKLSFLIVFIELFLWFELGSAFNLKNRCLLRHLCYVSKSKHFIVSRSESSLSGVNARVNNAFSNFAEWKYAMISKETQNFSFRKPIALLFLSCTLIYSVIPSISVAIDTVGIVKVEGELNQAFNKARLLEAASSFPEAQSIYEELVETEPNFILGWANLGNVLTSQGYLKEALLCYRKAISLFPPRDVLTLILLNKSAVETTLNDNKMALVDINSADKLSNGRDNTIKINKAVILSRLGQWSESVDEFNQIINSADRYALPWWLRYSMALLETSRSMESVAYLQRVLNRFPDEPECLAYAASLYSNLGSKSQAMSYWNKLGEDDRRKYSDLTYLQSTVLWGPKAVNGMKLFLESYRSNI